VDWLIDLLLLPFRVAGLFIILFAVVAWIAVAACKARNRRDWDQGCVCRAGPWGRETRPDCPIHGARRRPPDGGNPGRGPCPQ